MKKGLPPVVDERSTVLVLGSLPSDESILHGQYYAHPSNQFWTIIGSVLGEIVSEDYADRVAFLRTHGIALWDVFDSAERRGSSDSAIRGAKPNDIMRLLDEHPTIKVILLNGTKARDGFARSGGLDIRARCAVHYVPSSSPTPGMHVLGLAEKIQKWRDAVQADDPPSGQ